MTEVVQNVGAAAFEKGRAVFQSSEGRQKLHAFQAAAACATQSGQAPP